MTSPRHAEATPCRVWPGKVNRDGYGREWWQGRWHMAHRRAYERAFGPIPAGLEIDHLCRNKVCINADHLEAVTRAENMHRQPRIAARMAQTHCLHGHEYTPENTRMDARGCRSCRACHNARERARKAARRAAA